MPVPAPITPALLALLATLCAAPGPVGIPRSSSLPAAGARSPSRADDDLALLRDPAADPAARAAAARRLIAAPDGPARAGLAAIITSRDTPEPRAVAVREIRATAAAPAWLLPPLAEASLAATGADRAAVVDAVGSIRTRDAVRFLLDLTDSASPQPIRDAAFAALARLTGRTDIGADTAAWRTWFEPIQWLPEAEWLRVLTEGLAQGADRAVASRDRWLARAVETTRRLYVQETDPAERAAMLASLLRDEFNTMRRLGVELANREIANGRLLDTGVIRATIDLLSSPQPDLRRAAAELVYATAPPDAGAALSHALLAETDPAVAAALLRAVPAWPSPTVKPVVLRWLAHPGPAQRAAIDAAATLLQRGMMAGAESEATILAALRSTPIADLPGSGLRLLAMLGTEEDRAAIASLLASPIPGRRLQAAEALAAYADFVPRILEAARADAGLFLTYCRAAAAASPTLDAFMTASALLAPNDEARREGLSLIAARMDPRDLAPVARQIEDLRLRELLLSPLLGIPIPAPAPGAAPSTPEPSVVAGLMLLAQTRLDLRQPALALAALEPLAPVEDTLEAPQLDAIRVVSLLWLNRIDEALEIPAPASAWIEGLERSIELAHAMDIVDAIDIAFPAGPPEPERSRLAELRAQITAGIMGPPQPAPPQDGH